MDCTHTFHTGAGTGIQRVVRRFSDGLLEAASREELEVIPARVVDGQLLPLPVEGGRVRFPTASSAREEESASIATPWKRLLALRSLGHALNRLLRSRRVEAWLEAGPNEDGLVRAMASSGRSPRHADALELRPSDILLSLDSSWVYDIRTVFDAAGRVGATRLALLCDVLPLSHPQWFTEGTRRYFLGWLQAILPRLDGILAISNVTCEAVRSLASEGTIRAPRLPPCAAVHLGAETVQAAEGEVRTALRNLIGPHRPSAFLTVGTLEPRKNVDFALDLFDQLAGLGLECQWHLVGAAGWLSEATVRRIHGHPRFGRDLHWWTDLSDDELGWCYSHAAALVAVSRAEGFGLPLVEARMAGLPVFASDIAVFREVLGSEARYLPLSSPRLAAAVLEDFLTRSASQGRKDGSGIARTWNEATAQLLETMLRFDRQRRALA